MSWIKDVVDPKARLWEEFYRNRWQYDKAVRSTHGVNCTGGCSWMIFVKDGIVTWEMQATDYPKLEDGLPTEEPRGCQRGMSFSWYLYSPIRVKYPYIRGVLADLWREAKRVHGDPVAAWASTISRRPCFVRYSRICGRFATSCSVLIHDITPLVSRVIEHEMNGKFTGDGWKTFEPGV